MEGSPPGISHQLPLHGNRHRLVLRTSNADSASRRIRLTDSVSAVWRQLTCRLLLLLLPLLLLLLLKLLPVGVDAFHRVTLYCGRPYGT